MAYRKSRHRFTTVLLFLELAMSVGRCPAETVSSESLRRLCRDAVQHYAKIAFASYSDAEASARELHVALKRFTAAPSEQSLEDAKQAWIDARHPYLQTEVFRFYGGPIDDERGLEPLINGWPIDEFYIDYVEGAPESGIIQDSINYPRITPELLERQNERAGETAITCGFHAIEFLLWGQDRSDEGPGRRPVTDYTQSPHANRRKDYLLACGELLVRHLHQVARAWTPEQTGNYREAFLSNKPLRSFWYALYGLQTFAGKELAGERLLVAWDTQAQEDEHSCFSDNTLVDLQSDLLGISNLYHGVYLRKNNQLLRGPGLKTVFAKMTTHEAQELEHGIQEALRRAEAIPPPFDQAILGTDETLGRKSILACVEVLEDLAFTLSQIEQVLLQHRREGAAE